MPDTVISTLHQRLQGEQAQVFSASPDTNACVPAFQFSVLTCAPQLLATKTFYADGKECPFGHAKNFLFKYCEISSLEEFASALDWLANEPRRFIIRGQLRPGLDPALRHRRLLLSCKGDATIECPPRRWIVLDIDGAKVPEGLGAPDKVAEAGYHIRDNLLPEIFWGIRCIASATSSTGRKGPCTARLRLFFMLTEAVDNDLLYAWLEGLNGRIPAIDPSVCPERVSGDAAHLHGSSNIPWMQRPGSCVGSRPGAGWLRGCCLSGAQWEA
jgi:hypothetical protein